MSRPFCETWECSFFFQRKWRLIISRRCMSSKEKLWQLIRQPWNGLDQVVADHGRGEQDEENECSLIDAFLDAQADVAAHESFDQKEHDHATVKNGYGQQVEDAEVQADGRSQTHQRSPALAAGGFARGLANPD